MSVCLALDPRGEIDREADCALAVPALELFHLAHHDRTGRDTDARRDRPSLATDVLTQSTDQLQSCLNSTFCIVLVCHWITEICEHTVAQELRDLAAEGLNRGACLVVIRAQRVADLFSVKLLGHSCGLDQVAKHHREVPAFDVAVL